MESPPLVLEARRVGVLRSRLDESIVIYHPVGYRPQTLAEMGLIDCIIVETEDGFSQLGMMRYFLSQDLGLNERNLAQHALDGFPDTLERDISSLADWNRFNNPEVTLIAIPSERQHSHLKGVILAPYDGSECYRQYGWDYGTPRPHRDFIYNVTYEAIAHAYNKWGCKRIGITQFSRRKNRHDMTGMYHRDLTTCQVEAMAHFCNDHRGMESFTFLDDCEGNQPLAIAREFSELSNIGTHRQIVTKQIQFWGIDFVRLEWSKNKNTGPSLTMQHDLSSFLL